MFESLEITSKLEEIKANKVHAQGSLSNPVRYLQSLFFPGKDQVCSPSPSLKMQHAKWELRASASLGFQIIAHDLSQVRHFAHKHSGSPYIKTKVRQRQNPGHPCEESFIFADLYWNFLLRIRKICSSLSFVFSYDALTSQFSKHFLRVCYIQYPILVKGKERSPREGRVL